MLAAHQCAVQPRVGDVGPLEDEAHGNPPTGFENGWLLRGLEDKSVSVTSTIRQVMITETQYEVVLLRG